MKGINIGYRSVAIELAVYSKRGIVFREVLGPTIFVLFGEFSASLWCVFELDWPDVLSPLEYGKLAQAKPWQITAQGK